MPQICWRIRRRWGWATSGFPTICQFARVRAALAVPEGNAFIKNACAYAMEQADCLLETQPCTHCLLDGKRMLEVSREVLNRVATLGFA